MWSIVDRYLREHPKFWAQHQRDSFLDFRERRLLRVVQERVKCDHVKWEEPGETPDAVRRAGGTYAARVYAVNGRAATFLGTVPALTEDGAFVLQGRETWLPTEEVRSASSVQWSEDGVEAQGVSVVRVPGTEAEEHGELEVGVPGSAARAPLFVVMRALGVLSDKSICEHCLVGVDAEGWEARLRPSVHAAGRIYTILHARAFLQSRWGSLGALDKLTPHQVGYLAGLVLEGRRTENRAVELCGQVLERWFREALAEHLAEKPAERSLEAHCAQDALGAKVAARFPEGTEEPAHFYERLARARLVSSVAQRQWGFYDVAEEGAQLALLTKVSQGLVDAATVLKDLPALVPLKGATLQEHRRLVRVVVDGVWTVSTYDPEAVMAALRAARRQPDSGQKKDPAPTKRSPMEDVNFHWEPLRRCIDVRTREGRVQRPLFYIAADGRLSCEDVPAGWTWADAGVVEYADAAEAGSALIAVDRAEVTPRHTHLEVHPSLMLGARTNIAAALPEHMPADGLFKLGAFAERIRPPGAGDHVQVPLVHSGYFAAAGCAPYGVNALVAVCSAGYGAEGNALFLNQGAVDRGLFRCYGVRRYGVTLPVGKRVKCGEELASGVRADVSGVVEEGGAVRYARRPQAGDRFVARNGEVYVCGGLVRETDMPCTPKGVRPDALLPVSGEPTAASLLLEALMGRVHAAHGSFGDGTAFAQKKRAPFYAEQLRRLDGKSDDAMYHGGVGTMFAAPIFWGSIYLAPTADELPEVAARGQVAEVTRQPLQGCEFDETARDACLAHGMTAVLQDAHMARSDGSAAVVDGVSGLFAFSAGGTMVAPALDGPLQFDGALTPRPSRAEAFNTFTDVALPHAFRAMTQELAMGNVALRLATAPAKLRDAVREQVRGLYRAMHALTPEHLGNEFGASYDYAACMASAELWSYPTKPHPTLFPVVSTADWLKTLITTSLEIAPTADMRPAQFNADKLDAAVYSGMDWRSARHTLKYCFDRANAGVFVRIRGNRVVNFDPFGNAAYSNDFLHRLSLDGTSAATPEALRVALGAPAPARWTAAGNLLRLDTEPTDRFLAQLFDLLTETCTHRCVADCFFVVNRGEHPILGADGAEAFPAFYGPEKKLDPVWKGSGFIPVLSPCTSPAHADVPMPTADDWEAVTAKYFAAHRRNGELRCGNRYPNLAVKNWGDRDAAVEMDTGRRLPIFFWAGATVAGDEKHPRPLLLKAGDDYAKRGRRSDIGKSGLLKTYELPAPKLRAGASYDASTKLVLVHPGAKKKVPDAPTSLAAQAAKYKFIFHVEGNGAAPTLGAMFKHGFCVLHVESPFALWCESLLRGGDAEEYQPDWCYLKVRRDLGNLDSTIEWCLEHDAECKRIAENGRRVFDTYFTPAYMFDYLSSTLNSISSRQRGVELTQEEGVVRAKDVAAQYGKALLPDWRPFAAGREGGAPPHTVLLVAVYRGPHESAELAQFLKHYQSRNVLVVKGGLTAPRGGLYNAAVHFARKHAPDIASVVFLDLGARFRPEFVRAYFSANDPGVLDFGRLVAMPLGWATKFSLEAFVEMNGFPNAAEDSAAESAALLERLYRVRKRWTCSYPDGAPDVLSAKLPTPPATADLTVNAQASVLLDRVHWRMDGLNTVHYRVTEHVEGDWTASPKVPAANLRTLTVQLTPEASIDAIPSIPKPPDAPQPEATQPEAPKQETQRPIPEVHLEPMPEADMPVEIIIDDTAPASTEPLPLLENTETLPVSDAVTTKVISYDPGK